MLALPAARAQQAARIADALHTLSFDAAECHRVRDLVVTRDEVKIYFTSGYLIFAKPVEGRRVAAFFTADMEGGEGEALLLPPNRSERASLAVFAKTPNLSERFRDALLVFGDGAGDELLASIAERNREAPDSGGKSPEMGALLAGKWTPVLRSFTNSLEERLVEALLSARPVTENFFYCALGGRRLGNFDLIYDPMARDQITVGQLAYRSERTYFDIWTSFEGRSFRKGRPRAARDEVKIDRISIEASFDEKLRLSAVTRLRVTPLKRVERVLQFDISPRMTVTGAKVDGGDAEVFQRDSMRSNLIRGTENMAVLVLPSAPMEVGKSYLVEIRHEGEVVLAVGQGIYGVSARSNWYPNRDFQFANYDLTFRYPKSLDLVATGEVVEERVEGQWKITRRRPSAPVRFAGFNLGHYARTAASQAGFQVEVFGHAGMVRPAAPPLIMPTPGPPVWQRHTPVFPEISVEANARPFGVTPRMTEVASEVANAMEFMAQRFGPPALKRLTVSPIPGSFGQGFAGLIYLSNISYLPAEQRTARSRNDELFFSELLQAHETAHQWWGNVVSTVDYQDDWLMEALANYSALLYIEKRRGAKALEEVLADFRERLLSKDEGGKTLESAGPITWSFRLHSSQTPRAWRTITYDKGAWIMHMLRRRMGDQPFFAMLGELCRRYRFQAVTTPQFRALAVEYMPKDAPDRDLEGFFAQWVYGTGIPTLSMSTSVKGRAPKLVLTCTVKQSDVPGEFGVWVPVEVQVGRGKSVVKWVETGDEPATVTFDLAQPPVKVTLDPQSAVLARR